MRKAITKYALQTGGGPGISGKCQEESVPHCIYLVTRFYVRIRFLIHIIDVDKYGSIFAPYPDPYLDPYKDPTHSQCLI
jgi:hypothetical protein